MQRYYHLVIIAVLFLTAITKVAYAEDVLFVKENIAVTILPPDTVMVNGEYFFTSLDKMPLSRMLYYPFPVDTESFFPCSISVTKDNSPTKQDYSIQQKGISFLVTVHSGDTSEITVIYKQLVKNRSGTYILTTTSAWGKPLVNSHYSVSIPQTHTLSYMSYPSDSVLVCKNNLVYKFYKQQFMPDRDLSFTWSTH